tara:strand:- start:33 stop:449 length:417 start_codon:yes stop_codon:yes gene_type:complete
MSATSTLACDIRQKPPGLPFPLTHVNRSGDTCLIASRRRGGGTQVCITGRLDRDGQHYVLKAWTAEVEGIVIAKLPRSKGITYATLVRYYDVLLHESSRRYGNSQAASGSLMHALEPINPAISSYDQPDTGAGAAHGR